jgi:hypothetical protein
MFNLTETELDDAFSVINHHGYSTMLPEPYEWKRVKSNWSDIRNFIKAIDLDNYSPFKPMKVFAPKSRSNIRVVHLLHPQDLIIYTALVLVIKNDIEANRLTKKARRVFSYRIVKERDRLYESHGTYETYLDQLRAKSGKSSTRFVAVADIADFYPRIYQHRLENAVQAVASTQRGVEVARVLVRKLISNLMERNSYGIPVGPYASRVLAEALLIDVDSYLHSNGHDFVRWVDDYSVFCKTEYEAQSTLFKLGEWLYDQHGLTLQSAKTKILPVQSYISDVLRQPAESVRDRDSVISLFRGIDTSEYDDGWNAVEISDEVIENTLQSLQGLDLINMLSESISDRTLVDYEVISYVLTRLPRMPEALNPIKDRVLDFVIENAELLYPVAEQIAKYVTSFEHISKAEKKRIAKKLIKPIKSKRNPPPAFYSMWMLYIFSTSEDWNNIKEIIQIYQNSNSEVIKRMASLAIAKGGSRAEALIIKDDYTSASDLHKLSILEATNRLGTDERKHWRLSNQIAGILEKLI